MVRLVELDEGVKVKASSEQGRRRPRILSVQPDHDRLTAFLFGRHSPLLVTRDATDPFRLIERNTRSESCSPLQKPLGTLGSSRPNRHKLQQWRQRGEEARSHPRSRD